MLEVICLVYKVYETLKQQDFEIAQEYIEAMINKSYDKTVHSHTMNALLVQVMSMIDKINDGFFFPSCLYDTFMELSECSGDLGRHYAEAVIEQEL